MQNNKEALDFFDSLLTELPFGVIVIDKNGIVTLINPNALLFMGLQGSAAFYEDTNILSFISNRKLKNKIGTSLSSENPRFKLKALNVKNRYLNIHAKKLLNGFVINILDVTQNILMRDKATQSLILGQEKERK